MICLKYVILLSLDNEFKWNAEIFNNNTVTVEWAGDFFWTAEIAYEKNIFPQEMSKSDSLYGDWFFKLIWTTEGVLVSTA